MYRDFKSIVQPRINFLTEKQIREIHLSTLEILERTGILVNDAEAVEILAGAGCSVSGKNLVYIPAFLVEEAVRSAPPKVTIVNRNAERSLFLEGRKSFWGTGSDTPFILDSFTDKRRQTCLDDIKKVSILVDHLNNLDFLMSMGVAHDLPQTIADKYHFLTMVSNTTKPIVFTASSKENLSDIYEMACMIAGGEDSLRKNPFIIHYTEPIAPLIHPKDSLEKLLFCVEKGIPVIYTSATTAGQNGPVTLAADIALSNARILSGIVIAQQKCKGAKMIVTMHASAMDVTNAIHTYASPEHIICQAVAKDLANHYQIPTWGRAGCTESKIIDEQASFESGLEILVQALCGENLIHDVGYIESGLTASWDAIVMANEFISIAKRVVRGFELSSETLALDLIDKVGPAGHFLDDPHTVKHFKEELFIPNLIDRDNFQSWESKGRTTLLQRAKIQVKEILKTHKPEPLDPTLTKELELIARKDNIKDK